MANDIETIVGVISGLLGAGGLGAILKLGGNKRATARREKYETKLAAKAMEFNKEKSPEIFKTVIEAGKETENKDK